MSDETGEACARGVESASSERERVLVRDVTAVAQDLETMSDHDHLRSSRMLEKTAREIVDAVHVYADDDA